MYLCSHFDIYELVDKKTFDHFGLQAWMFLNPEALAGLDGLREFFNRPVNVNNWFWGGDLQFRGLRPRSCPVGAEYSQHRLGNAFDCDVEGLTAEEARKQILQNKDHPLLHRITCIEADVSWLHVDFRNVPDRIRVVHP